MITTLDQAVGYVFRMYEMGRRHAIFAVPEGTHAFNIGYRFATCEADELEDYQREGADFYYFKAFGAPYGADGERIDCPDELAEGQWAILYTPLGDPLRRWERVQGRIVEVGLNV